MAARKLHLPIFRHNPYDPESKPRMQEYVLDETPRMTLFTALTWIREEMDPSVQFDFVCRSAICGSCAVLVNGEPRLACQTRTEELPDEITLLPLPFFRLVGDLSVDTGSWFAAMSQRVESWVHTTEAFDPETEEQRMSNVEAQEIYNVERCIECGCCLASCGNALMRDDFLGAAGLLRVARFMLDPRDERSDGMFYEVIGNEEGSFGCIGLLGCDDYCPKDLPLAEQLAYVRRKMLLSGLGLGARKARDGASPTPAG
jgi:succinate dehydrogenase iron-sulfur subunit